jgi:hypothetical protein
MQDPWGGDFFAHAMGHLVLGMGGGWYLSHFTIQRHVAWFGQYSGTAYGYGYGR